MREEYKNNQKTKANVKRMAITMFCSIPLLFVVGLLLEGLVNRAVRMLIFIVILVTIVLLEEYIYAKIKKKKPNIEIEKEDVFK